MNTPHEIRSELRENPVTGKWVLLAPGRGMSPENVARTRPAKPALPAFRDDCPFCDLRAHPQEPDTLILPKKGKDWRVRVFPNKHPAVSLPHGIPERWTQGPYRSVAGEGFHEVMIPKAHDGVFHLLSRDDAALMIRAWRERYLALMANPSVAYIQIIQNHGAEAGASQQHPHMQLFAVPVLPTDEVLDLLEGAERYAQQHGRCGYCDMLAFERKEQVRLVHENHAFVSFAAYAPEAPFELWILPKNHAAGFHMLRDDELPALADILQETLKSLARALHDPPHNLCLYSAPCDTEGYVCDVNAFSHFHWHLEIRPRIGTLGGFEVATGMEIVTVTPEDAAAFLRTAGTHQQEV